MICEAGQVEAGKRGTGQLAAAHTLPREAWPPRVILAGSPSGNSGGDKGIHF